MWLRLGLWGLWHGRWSPCRLSKMLLSWVSAINSFLSVCLAPVSFTQCFGDISWDLRGCARCWALVPAWSRTSTSWHWSGSAWVEDQPGSDTINSWSEGRDLIFVLVICLCCYGLPTSTLPPCSDISDLHPLKTLSLVISLPSVVSKLSDLVFSSLLCWQYFWP